MQSGDVKDRVLWRLTEFHAYVVEVQVLSKTTHVFQLIPSSIDAIDPNLLMLHELFMEVDSNIPNSSHTH